MCDQAQDQLALARLCVRLSYGLAQIAVRDIQKTLRAVPMPRLIADIKVQEICNAHPFALHFVDQRGKAIR